MKKQIYKNTLLIIAVVLLILSLLLGIGMALTFGYIISLVFTPKSPKR